MENHPKTVAVTGATGFVGRHLCRELTARGHAVRALVRDQTKASRMLPASGAVEHVVGDAHDSDAVAKLVDGVDACAHLIGIIREAPAGQTFHRIHAGATHRIVEACTRAGVRRYLHMSALGASPDGPAEYQKTKFEAERLVINSGLDWTIFRPGLIHGPDGEFFQQLKGWAEGRAQPFLFMPYFSRVQMNGPPTPFNPPRFEAPTVAPVYVGDVAKAFAEALDRPQAVREVFPLSGPELITWPEMLRTVRDTLPQGKKELRAVGVPGPIAAAQAKLASAVGLGQLLPFDEGMAAMGSRDSFADLHKAREMLGFDPEPFEQSLRRYAA